jgi:uncharacterized protein YdhG (YjbR/CyaY superfamily)
MHMPDTMADTVKSIDAYIAGFPPDVRDQLARLREAVRDAAPEAMECISYGMPCFRLHRNLVYFAAYGRHIGFYPTSSGIRAFASELRAYETSRGTVRFPLDRPLPLDLVRRIVTFRVEEERERRQDTQAAVE